MRAVSVAIIALTAMACGNGVGPEDVAGTYVATTFTVAGDVEGDVLVSGGNLTITLNADGTTTGTLFIPAALNDGVDFTADLAGRFTVSGQAVLFDQAADTFIRDIVWALIGNELRGFGEFDGVTINVVMTRQ